jgi:D-3-phosphoglycerate dehydrogenase
MMPGVHVAVLDQFHPAIMDAIKEGLPADWTVAFARNREIGEMTETARNADVILIVGAPVPTPVVMGANRLRIVQKLGAGVDNIDVNACASRGVAVARLNAGNNIPVAEHTVMMMLAALRRLPQIDRRTRSGEWIKEEARGVHRQLSGKRVGLIGCGAIGRTVARMLSGFEVDAVYFDPRRMSEDAERSAGLRYFSMDELLETSDVVSLHLPLLPETRNILGAPQLARMKRGAVVINCARGGLIDEAALCEALASGHLMAAALDTFAVEPAANNPLFELDSVVVTSHLAGATIDNFALVLERGIANISGYLKTGTLPTTDVVHLPLKQASGI